MDFKFDNHAITFIIMIEVHDDRWQQYKEWMRIILDTLHDQMI